MKYNSYEGRLFEQLVATVTTRWTATATDLR